uniref:Uncharacterized protein n=1 Tax=Apteryx owenii TaxID=8824 RepID=A0A8B9Q1B5_APTOW
MAEAGTGFLEQLKSCIVWSWTYLWTLWFFIMLFLVYILRVPLKINDNLTTDISNHTNVEYQQCAGHFQIYMKERFLPSGAYSPRIRSVK